MDKPYIYWRKLDIPVGYPTRLRGIHMGKILAENCASETLLNNKKINTKFEQAQFSAQFCADIICVNPALTF